MCGCSKTTNVPLVLNRQAVTHTAPVDCNKSKEEVEEIEKLLISRKNPENAKYINSQLGLIQSMHNLNNYCLYDVLPF